MSPIRFRLSGCPLETLLKPNDSGGRRRQSSRQRLPSPGPYFDLHRTRNVTAFKGVTAFLVCRVRRLGNNTVRSSHIFYSLGRQVSDLVGLS